MFIPAQFMPSLKVVKNNISYKEMTLDMKYDLSIKPKINLKCFSIPKYSYLAKYKETYL
jgi:hypothetical protein